MQTSTSHWEVLRWMHLLLTCPFSAEPCIVGDVSVTPSSNTRSRATILSSEPQSPDCCKLLDSGLHSRRKIYLMHLRGCVVEALQAYLLLWIKCSVTMSGSALSVLLRKDTS